MSLLLRRIGRHRRLAVTVVVALVTASVVASSPSASADQQVHVTANARSAASGPNPPALAPEPSWAPMIDQLTESILGRAASSSERQRLGSRMEAATGAPTAVARDIASELAHGSEASDVRVRAAYEGLLGRTADPGGLAFWSGWLGRHNTIERLWSVIADAGEFAHSTGSFGVMVERQYQTILGRAADPAGKAFWTSYLTRHRPGSLADILTRSSEYARRTVTGTYVEALHRTPDPHGLAYWSHRVASGRTGAIGLLSILTGTAESVHYGCDPTATSGCLLPFPNDRYTRPDPSTATGRRVDLKPVFTPTNTSGTHIDTRQINRSDGFSPGAPAIVQIPGLDLDNTAGVPTVDQPSKSLDPDAPVMVIDTTTGDQWPVWAELDHFGSPGPNPMLYIRPATNYVEGHTYVVVLRNLKDSAGAPIAADPVFDAYLNGHDLPGVAGFEAHKAAVNHVLDELDTWGVPRTGVYRAWQFTVASAANLTGRLLHIRDDAFNRIGGPDGLTDDAVPSFSVSSVDSDTDWPGIARDIVGTFEVPSYLTGDGSPGSTFDTGPNGLPQYTGHSSTADFRCIVADDALTTPAIPTVYGHGLFGTKHEVRSDSQRAMVQRFGRVYCATDEIGMADPDQINALGILQDLSRFDELVDRLQQGVLNELFLARLLNSPNGFVTDPAFQNASGAGVIEPHRVTYDGNSQGGILGGVLTAVSTDFTHAVLGTTGTDYATLMQRSVDFSPFFSVLNSSYPDRTSQIIAVDLIQMQWDRAEPNGYISHLTDNLLPNTPAHKVLVLLAYGDHQVTNWAGDVEARTIARNGDLRAHCPKVESDRTVGEWPLWNVPCIASYPYGGSAVVYNDTGSNRAPLINVPPPEPDGDSSVAHHDPHNDPQKTPEIQDMKDVFLRPGGTVTDTCGGACKFPPPS